MALVNFTLPFGNTLPIQPWTTISPLQRHATAINNMLYDPAGHQQQQQQSADGSDNGGDGDDYYDEYKHDPYAPPAVPQQQQLPPQRPQAYRRTANSNDYLPPDQQQQQQQRQHQQQQYQPQRTSAPGVRNLYLPQPPSVQSQQQQPPVLRPPQLQPPNQQFYSNHNVNNQQHQQTQQPHRVTYPQANGQTSRPPPPPVTERSHTVSGGGPSREHTVGLVDGDGLEQPDADNNGGYPSQVPTYTRVQAGAGANTQVHAVLDYDADDGEEDYDDGEDDGQTYKMPTVTPIQGPIFLKNGSVPVVPLFSYPTLRNGSFMQIPIWWTALSVALGLEIRGDVIRGTPCVKRHNQLFCPTAGTSYPINRIESFIDENKALMRRMYGDFEMSTQYGPPSTKGKRKRQTDEFHDGSLPPGVPDFVGPPGSDMDEIPSPDVMTGDSYFSKWRSKRQTGGRTAAAAAGRSGASGNAAKQQSAGPTPPNEKVTGRLDACESKIEIVTPYWASNSAGKVRAIVNTQHFEQAIHQEVCTKTQTGRCGGECGCEQKYKWHRLLAYDPDNDCRGIFMDWFLFPSCCVCRCDP